MTLFRRDNLPLGFDFVGLGADDLSDLTELVERHGGKIVHDDNLPIKFTKPAGFVTEAFPKFKLYDVEFIRECVKKSAIVDPTSYRIGKPMLYDNCVMFHYLKGLYNCCTPAKKLKTPDDKKLLNKTTELVVRRRPGRPRKNEFARHTIGETGCGGFKTSSPENIIMLTPDSQQSDSSDDEMMMSVAKRRRGRGTPFTFDEDAQMIKYVLDRHLGQRSANSPKVWEDMAKEILPHRTPQTLYKHYREILLPNIADHEVTAKQLMMFKEIHAGLGSSIKKEKLAYSFH